MRTVVEPGGACLRFGRRLQCRRARGADDWPTQKAELCHADQCALAVAIVISLAAFSPVLGWRFPPDCHANNGTKKKRKDWMSPPTARAYFVSRGGRRAGYVSRGTDKTTDKGRRVLSLGLAYGPLQVSTPSGRLSARFLHGAPTQPEPSHGCTKTTICATPAPQTHAPSGDDGDRPRRDGGSQDGKPDKALSPMRKRIRAVEPDPKKACRRRRCWQRGRA